ncbi:DUF3159 domain-containing protein [Kribbella catacumbae]|uniref:DUF3159 domain-containing protein n=1 Tax=Kribbella catacumbae TaxID=460086 RepID=UPI000369AD37|nr:DUF3159 domain-containing protein [Kribbella catacumbae]
MAEPQGTHRDQLDEDLNEKLVEILKPEVEAAGTVPPADDSTAESTEAQSAEDGPAKPEATTDKDFFHALGGWGALLDIGLPWIAFMIVYAASDHNLKLALIVAVACGAAVALLRLVRKQPLRNVIGGFIGVAFSAWVANRSGKAENVYLPGMILSGVYLTIYGLSIVVRWPLFGAIYGLITQTGAAWRRDPDMYRGFNRATLVFAGLFAVRLVIQIPLYLTEQLNALGIAKIGLGLPLYALALWLSYSVLRGSLPDDKWDETRDHVTGLLRAGGKK